MTLVFISLKLNSNYFQKFTTIMPHPVILFLLDYR